MDLAGVYDEAPHTGRERLIFELAAKCMKRELVVELAPYGRHLSYFKRTDKFDAVGTVPAKSEVSGFESISHIEYQNVVTTLDKPNWEIKSVADLKGLDVVSFKGARTLLPGLNQAVASFKSYQEIAQQELHSRMLLLKRADAVISDKYIFYSHTKKLIELEPNRKEFLQKTKSHNIFPASKFSASFKNSELRDEFNKCILNNQSEIKAINHRFSL